MNFLKLPDELIDVILSYNNIFTNNYNKVIREILFIHYRYNFWTWNKFYADNFYKYALTIDLKNKHKNNIEWKQKKPLY